MNKKIAVLLGGISVEKEVSLETGKYVVQSLEEQGYKVKKIRVSFNKKLLIKTLKEFRPDLVFNALHGTFGEDGQVQKLLDKLKLRYSHSSAKASKIAMDKKKQNWFLKRLAYHIQMMYVYILIILKKK